MADLVLGLILTAGLTLLVILAINHSQETRRRMIEEMEDDLEDETSQEETPQPETSKAENEKKPATKKRSSKKQTS